jgi:hypothetical protein
LFSTFCFKFRTRISFAVRYRALSIQMPAIPGTTTYSNYRKVYYKSYFSYCKENRLRMLQQRQIVKPVDNQINTGDPIYTKYPIIYFHFIAWTLISINVTTYRTNTAAKSYQSSHWIMMITTKLRSNI